MSAVVVDTNVAIVANGRTPQAGPACVINCIDALARARSQGRIILDNLGRILQEYRRHLSAKGQPGVGDAFFKWIWDNQGNAAHCEIVEIHPRNGDEDYAEFPAAQELAGFHRKDRKFVAVALASKSNPEILNAVDQDWWDYRSELAGHGLRITFLCPGQFQGGS